MSHPNNPNSIDKQTLNTFNQFLFDNNYQLFIKIHAAVDERRKEVLLNLVRKRDKLASSMLVGHIATPVERAIADEAADKLEEQLLAQVINNFALSDSIPPPTYNNVYPQINNNNNNNGTDTKIPEASAPYYEPPSKSSGKGINKRKRKQQLKSTDSPIIKLPRLMKHSPKVLKSWKPLIDYLKSLDNNTLANRFYSYAKTSKKSKNKDDKIMLDLVHREVIKRK